MYIHKFMKSLTICALSFSMLGISLASYPKVVARDLATNVVRLHVRANSDEPSDQSLKLKVRNSIIGYLADNMDCHSQAEAVSFIGSHTNAIIATARNTVSDNGYDYSVSAVLGNSSFPDRSYGGILFPSGEYCSLIVNIGSGEGHNWWCVLYPPLCLIDNVTAKFPENQSEASLDDISGTDASTNSIDVSDNLNSEFSSSSGHTIENNLSPKFSSSSEHTIEDNNYPEFYTSSEPAIENNLSPKFSSSSEHTIEDNVSSNEYEYITKEPVYRFKYFTFLNRFLED